MQETWVRSVGQEDPREKGMATHSSILPWRIPWTEEPGGLQSMGSETARRDWTIDTFTFTFGGRRWGLALALENWALKSELVETLGVWRVQMLLSANWRWPHPPLRDSARVIQLNICNVPVFFPRSKMTHKNVLIQRVGSWRFLGSSPLRGGLSSICPNVNTLFFYAMWVWVGEALGLKGPWTQNFTTK